MTTETWEPLEAKYKPQLITLAETVAKTMRESGNDWAVSEVSDFTDSDLAVFFLVESPNREPIDITFRLLDAAEWDGTESGTSFACDIVAEGGRIVGGFHPYNYSDDVWVDPTDTNAVETRWELFRNATNAEDIITLLENYWSE